MNSVDNSKDNLNIINDSFESTTLTTNIDMNNNFDNKKKSKKVWIILLVFIIILIVIGSFSYYKYTEYKKEQYEIYLQKKEEERLRKLAEEEARKTKLIENATLAIESLYENEVPKKNMTDENVLLVKEKVNLIEDEEIKNEMLILIQNFEKYLSLDRKINSLYVNDVLISSCTNGDIIEIEEAYNNLNEEWKSIFNDSVSKIKMQKFDMDSAYNSVVSLFTDSNLSVVKTSVTRSQYNIVFKKVNALPQTDLVKSYESSLDKVLKVIEEQEEKEEKARREAEEKARREAEEKARREAEAKAKREAEIKAAWKVLETPYISQNNNQIYNGCEAASLLMALQYKGYLKSMTLYQYALDIPKSDDPHQGFVHDIFGYEPRDVSHWIAPDALSKFGRDSSGNSNVIDITGSSFATLKNEIKNGNPVVIYLTGGNLNAPIWVEGEEVPKNLHVMLMIGYNSITNQIVINDPWTKTSDGKVYYSENQVVSIYNQVGKKAIVIR